MIFEQIRVGGDRNFAYLIGDPAAKRAAVADPAYDPDMVLDRAGELGLEVAYLINTHGHFDHAGGNDRVLQRTGAELLRAGAGGVDDGASVSLGSVTLTFIHTPGHTADSMCILAEEPGEAGKLVTGDTLFVGKVGGTGYGRDARQEYDSLHEKLLGLPDETEVWPGHDYGAAPSSTIGRERETNPFLLQPDFDAFVDLKRNWLEYKRRHGIA
ncbi:MAG: MBL fold metallo-hydrolase [Candidatus Eisenbacteria bacterium]|nr:MBL fold metallo-hydrolase [Candidatus Eisenbacteria bacterium]